MLDCDGAGGWPNSSESSGSSESKGERLGKGRERLMKAEVREKINKIRIYRAILIVHICMVTVANMYIYTILEGLIQNKFKRYCVNFASFSILHIFTSIDVNAVHICTVTVVNVNIYIIIEGLIQSKFKRYCVNFASFSILHIFTSIDVNALKGL